jgi:hypothetical protein
MHKLLQFCSPRCYVGSIVILKKFYKILLLLSKVYIKVLEIADLLEIKSIEREREREALL